MQLHFLPFAMGAILCICHVSAQTVVQPRPNMSYRVVVNGSAGMACDAIESLRIGPDGMTVYYNAKRRDKWTVVTNGEPGPAFDKICESGMSEDGRHWWYVGGRGTERVLMVDGKEVATGDDFASIHLSKSGQLDSLAIRREGRWSVRVGGKEWKTKLETIREVVRLASGSTCVLGGIGGKQFCIKDDEQGMPFEKLIETGWRIGGISVFVVRDGKEQRLVVEGSAGPSFVVSGFNGAPRPGEPEFPNCPRGFPMVKLVQHGQNWAYAYHTASGRWRMNVNGTISTETFDAVLPYSTQFLADGRLVYIAATNPNGYSVVLDGKPGPAFEQILHLKLSADQKSLTYVGVRRNGKCCVVSNGAQGKDYDEIRFGVLGFNSSTGKPWYVARNNGMKTYFLINGETEELTAFPGQQYAYDGCLKDEFAPRERPQSIIDGQLYSLAIEPGMVKDGFTVFVAKAPDGKQRIIVNGQVQSAEFDELWFDLPNSIAKKYVLAVVNKGVHELWINNKLIGRYQDIRPGKSNVSGRLVLALKEAGQWKLRIDESETPAFEAVDAMSVTFSPERNQVAYPVKVGGKWTVALNHTAQAITGDGVLAMEFSPDGKRFAYLLNDDKGRQCLVVDAKPSRWQFGFPAPEVFAVQFFTADSKHTVYLGTESADLLATGLREINVCIDGVPQKLPKGVVDVKVGRVGVGESGPVIAYVERLGNQ